MLNGRVLIALAALAAGLGVGWWSEAWWELLARSAAGDSSTSLPFVPIAWACAGLGVLVGRRVGGGTELAACRWWGGAAFVALLGARLSGGVLEAAAPGAAAFCAAAGLGAVCQASGWWWAGLAAAWGAGPEVLGATRASVGLGAAALLGAAVLAGSASTPRCDGPTRTERPALNEILAGLLAGACVGFAGTVVVSCAWQASVVGTATPAQVVAWLSGGAALGCAALAVTRGVEARGALAALLALGAAAGVWSIARGAGPHVAAALLGGAGGLCVVRSAGPALFGGMAVGSLFAGDPRSLALLPACGTIAAAAAALCAGRPRAGTAVRRPRLVLLLASLLALPTPWLLPAPVPFPRGDLAGRYDGSAGVPSIDSEVRIDGYAGLDSRALQPIAFRAGRLAAAMHPAARSVVSLSTVDGAAVAGLLASTGAARQVCVVSPAFETWAQARRTAAAAAAGGSVAEIVGGDELDWLSRHEAAWDLVVIGPPDPPRRDESRRHGRAFAQAVRRALAADGVAVQWYALANMDWPAFQAAASAWLRVFPDARAFVASPGGAAPLVALVGGLSGGLPDAAAVDALLGARPSPSGPSAAVDVHDVYLADAWSLARAARAGEDAEEPVVSCWRDPSSGRQPSPQRAARNLRLLAALAAPLETASLAVRPADEKDDRRLGAELTARSAALVALLHAAAAGIELEAAVDGALSPDRVSALEAELHSALLAGWAAAGGHLDVRDALLERSLRLTRDDRWQAAAALLDGAGRVHPDGRLLGLQCLVLLELGDVERSLEVGLRARDLASEDRTVLVNLGSALVHAGRDEEGRQVLLAARRAYAPRPLPAQAGAALDVLERAPGAVQAATRLLERLPPGDRWKDVLRRLLSDA